MTFIVIVVVIVIAIAIGIVIVIFIVGSSELSARRPLDSRRGDGGLTAKSALSVVTVRGHGPAAPNDIAICGDERRRAGLGAPGQGLE